MEPPPQQKKHALFHQLKRVHSRHSVTFTDVSGLGLCKWCHQIKQIPAPWFQFWRLPSKLGQVGVIFPKGKMETQISTASCYKQVTNHVNQVTSNVDWEGSWSWRTWRFPQWERRHDGCPFIVCLMKTLLYTASSGSRIQNSNTVNGQIPPPVWKVWNTYAKSKKMRCWCGLYYQQADMLVPINKV